MNEIHSIIDTDTFKHIIDAIFSRFSADERKPIVVKLLGQFPIRPVKIPRQCLEIELPGLFRDNSAEVIDVLETCKQAYCLEPFGEIKKDEGDAEIESFVRTISIGDRPKILLFSCDRPLKKKVTSKYGIPYIPFSTFVFLRLIRNIGNFQVSKFVFIEDFLYKTQEKYPNLEIWPINESQKKEAFETIRDIQSMIQQDAQNRAQEDADDIGLGSIRFG